MILNKVIFSYLLFVILLSCTQVTSKSDLSGEYRSKTYSYYEKLMFYFNKETYTLHSIIVLKKDSSFLYTTCGNEMKGKWRVKYDSLILECKQNTFRNDSINTHRQASCGEKPIKYLIDYKKMELIGIKLYDTLIIHDNFVKVDENLNK